jgi:tRNA-binding protein
MKEQIDFSDFQKVDIRTGTILKAELNPQALKPAYVMQIDFGELGVKTSSAQLTKNYTADVLTGKQIIAVVNFPPKRIAGVKSEVLVLGALSEDQDVVLLEPGLPIENGAEIA